MSETVTLSQLERNVIAALRLRLSRLDPSVATWEFRITHYADGSMVASLIDTGLVRITPDHKFQECNK